MSTLSTSEATASDRSDSHSTLASDWQIVQVTDASQRWELTPGRFTIGSNAQCQVCLNDAELRPLHCLIVRTDRQIEITAWAPGALLNGTEFSSATISAGDVLKIGQSELRFESSAVAEPTVEQIVKPETPEQPAAEKSETEQTVEEVVPISEEQPIIPRPTPQRVETVALRGTV